MIFILKKFPGHAVQITFHKNRMAANTMQDAKWLLPVALGSNKIRGSPIFDF